MRRTHVVLLSGVDVGGRPLLMDDLRSWAVKLGFRNVRTLLASGNLVVEGGDATGSELEAFLEREAEEGLDLPTAFFVRTPDEWRALVAENPFRAEAESRPARVVAQLTKQSVGAARLKELRDAITGPERIESGDRVPYPDCPNGQGRSTPSRDWAKLEGGPVGTSRNWNTVVGILRAVEG